MSGHYIALENREGVFHYLAHPTDPSEYIVIVVCKTPPPFKTEGTLDELDFRKIYFKRTDEVVPHMGVACTVFKQEPE